MSVSVVPRIGVVVATIAAAAVVASPDAFAASLSIANSNAKAPVAGGSIRATASIGSGVKLPATLQIKLYPGAGCAGDALGASKVWSSDEGDPDQRIVAGGGDYTFTVANIDAGTYSWKAVLTENGKSPAEACSSSQVVTRVTPHLSATTTNAGAGGHIKATATLSDRVKAEAQPASVSMTFALYPPSDPTCAGAPLDTTTVPVYNSGDTYSSHETAAPSAGTYRWKISYSGDRNNAAVALGCGVAASVVTAGSAPPPSTATPTCAGVPATIVGTNAGETILGTNGDDVIVAGGGDDVVNGKGGNDLICGGPGRDTLRGGAGDDVLHGADGADLLDGGRGNDRLYGERGGDRLVGGAGNDQLYGGAGNDGLDGGAGMDSGTGGAGADVARGVEHGGT